MTSPIFGSRSLSFMLASADAFLTTPKAWISASGMRSPLILKFSRLRCVCAPQYLSAGTWIGPKVSVSVRIGVMRACSNWRRISPRLYNRIFGGRKPPLFFAEGVEADDLARLFLRRLGLLFLNRRGERRFAFRGEG